MVSIFEIDNNILIYIYQIWVDSSVRVGSHVQLLKWPRPPTCIYLQT